ncbi:MAG TPA: tetratricopeptide repeat protein [Acidobacteriaceae bacterium]|nr:tetratricopeptide repeat protein [Acidobacteriaceae bacterium]
MSALRFRFIVGIATITGLGFSTGWARDVRLAIPKHSELTPVQRLNRQGVDAVRKHQYEKAEAIFYKAYLYDAADPFTLNNLGYISELQGNLTRAQKFYALASQQGSDAVIDRSNTKRLEGKPMTSAFSGMRDVPMHVNRMNVGAIQLLGQRRDFEAEALLKKALTLEPDNPFTLNNMGVAEEATGDLTSALRYYQEAAAAHSTEPIVVTLERSSRGKPVSQTAAASAQKLKRRLRHIDPAHARATMLTLRGVSAINQNDWATAKKDLQEAYSLDPSSAFSLNNLGYLAEKDGDLETAQYYYSKAREAEDARARVGLATQSSAEGQHLVAVASDSGQKVDTELARYSQAERQQTGPVVLLHRDNTPVNTNPPAPAKPPVQPGSPAAPSTPNPPNGASQPGRAPQSGSGAPPQAAPAQPATPAAPNTGSPTPH